MPDVAVLQLAELDDNEVSNIFHTLFQKEDLHASPGLI
jgi:hypothetical protein